MDDGDKVSLETRCYGRDGNEDPFLDDSIPIKVSFETGDKPGIMVSVDCPFRYYEKDVPHCDVVRMTSGYSSHVRCCYRSFPLQREGPGTDC